MTEKGETTLPAFPFQRNDTLRLFVSDETASWLVPLQVGESIIGRGAECHVQLEDSTVSRAHVAVRVDDVRTVFVRDLGSSNGSTLNGGPIQGEAPFKPGDVLQVGHATIYLFLGSPADAQRLANVPELHRRIVAEIERAVRNDCPCALLELRLEAPTPQVIPTLVKLLRPGDTITEISAKRVLVLLPETPAASIGELAQRTLEALVAIGVRARIGVATAPLDAADVHALQEAARLAANSAALGAIAEPEHVRRIAIGSEEALVGDPEMARTYALLERLAPTQVPVLITGDTGVGKEFAAMLLHERSPRRTAPFMTVNCAAIAPGIAEAELFGHARGAFTGAIQARAGLIESANGGTLFLDEVGELSPAVQANLLRVLETRTVVRIGEVKPRPVDVRLVAATHRDLERDVRAGRFREDLFFRIVGAQVHLPPLRARPKEILPLATAFLRSASGDRPPPSLTRAARDLLMQYSWPGNVRELRHAMHFVVGTCAEQVVRCEHLPARIQETTLTTEADDPHPLSTSPMPNARARQQTIPDAFRPIAHEVRELEIERITQALEVSDGNKTKAAALIGMPLRTFAEKMKQYGIARERPR